MDDAIRRRLAGGTEPSDEPMEEGSGMNNLSEQMVAGLAGVRALHASGWDPPADLEWQGEQDEWHVAPTVQKEASGTGIDARTLAIGAGLFLLAALPRLFVIFFVTDPQNPGLGWYSDAFHHWQIAYLSKEIGFSQGFLTLWDFKGMEYFWGLLHPLVVAALFAVTGSVNIVVPRLLSLVASSASIGVLYVLLKRYLNPHIALAAIFLVIVNPVAIFGDTSGMQEPLGLVLLLVGLALWPRHPTWGGIAWGIAGMARAEYWLIGAALVVAAAFSRKEGDRRFLLAAGWVLPSVVYMKYLLDKTGNAIYPVYWNFVGNVRGEWMTDRPLTDQEIIVQWIGRLVFLFTLAAALWVFRKRGKGYLFYLLGLANILLLATMVGFSAYVTGLGSRILIGRLVAVPYIYLAVFVAIVLLGWLPRNRPRRLWLGVGWFGIAILGGMLQLAWGPVLGHYNEKKGNWAAEKQLAAEIAAFHEGGAIAIPEYRAGLTYALVSQQGIGAQDLVSQMYDPFFYFEGDPYANWEENREAIPSWFNGLNIRTIVVPRGKATYEELVRREESWFAYQGPALGGSFQIYEVLAQDG